MIIDINDLIKAKLLLRSLDDVDLSEIEFVNKSEKIICDNGVVEAFKYTGLNNADFILRDYYLLTSEQIRDLMK